MTGSKIVDQVK